MSANKDKPDGTDGGLALAERTQTKKPALYRVIMLNDDYTPMEYVVKLLRAVFNKSESDAVNVMLMVHNKGAGVCGIFPKDIAETKVFTD